MDVLLVLVGGLIAMVASILTEVIRQRGQRNELLDDVLRRAYGDFVAAATKARYQYEQRAQELMTSDNWKTSDRFQDSDNEIAATFHKLAIVSPPDTLDAARSFREHIEMMKHWIPEENDPLGHK